MRVIALIFHRPQQWGQPTNQYKSKYFQIAFFFCLRFLFSRPAPSVTDSAGTCPPPELRTVLVRFLSVLSFELYLLFVSHRGGVRLPAWALL